MAIKKLGTIVNLFGLKGQLKVSLSTTQAEDRFKVGKKIIIKNELGEDETYIIKSATFKNSRIAMIGLEGYDDINEIQHFINKDIYANVTAKKGTFFYDDLVGMEVISVNEEVVGKVTTVNKMPAGDYLLVEGKIYIPFIMDTFIKNVDKKSKKIYLTELGTEVTK